MAVKRGHMHDAHIFIGQTKDLKTVVVDIKNAAGGPICCLNCTFKYLAIYLKALKRTSRGMKPDEVN